MKKQSLAMALTLPAWCATLIAAYYLGTSASDKPDALTALDTDAIKAAPAKTTPEPSFPVYETVAETESIATAARNNPVASLVNQLGNQPSDVRLWRKAMAAAAFISPEEAAQLLAELEDLPYSENRNRLTLAMLANWAEGNPEAAMAYANSVEALNLRTGALREALRGWSRANPAEAAQWLDANRHTLQASQYGQMLTSLMDGFAENDLEGAFHYLAGLPASTIHPRVIDNATSQLVEVLALEGDMAISMAYLDLLPEGGVRNIAYRELAGELAKTDPQRGIDLLEQMADTRAHDRMEREFFEDWAQVDPYAAAHYLDTMAQERGYDPRLVSEIIHEWARNDVTGAAEWLNGIELTEDYDWAIGSIAMNAMVDDPAAAMTWVDSMQNSRRKVRFRDRVAQQWKYKDPDGFAQYLNSESLSDAERNRLMDVQNWTQRY